MSLSFNLTADMLGDGATEATAEQFNRACDAVMNSRFESGYKSVDLEQVEEYVWNNGKFDVTIMRELGEEVVT